MERDRKKGKVWLVGAGPSDPGLFTLKGKKVLEECDVVIYDRLAGEGILAMIPDGKEMIDVGKKAGNHPVPQDQINRIILEKAQEGLKVARLKGGDPFVFGRGGEELELLVENDIQFEIVPGITSAVSVPAYSGIPVTHRDFTSSFHVITGHTKKSETAETDYEALVRLDGTLIFLMGVGAMKSIAEGLTGAGMDPDMPAAVLEKGTTARQRKVVATVGTIYEECRKAQIGTPAIIIVGKVCGLSDRFAWAEKRELAGLRIGVTRPAERGSALADMIREKGGEAVLMPAVRTYPADDMTGFENALDRIEDFSMMAFTSPYGVRVVRDHLKKTGRDIRNLAGVKLAAIGSATAKEIENMCLVCDYMPSEYSGKALGELICEKYREENLTGSILLPRSQQGTDQVTAPLDREGIPYEDVHVYVTDELPENTAGPVDIDIVAFTSASTVRAYAAGRSAEAGGAESLKGTRALCIGRQTAAEAEKYGMDIRISEKATLSSMVEALEEWRKEIGE